ncbi:MAG: hypothetical protein DHS80DRAFT_21339 [Piptocephalis tieghemiana]|nr:MAG: hypothetical protein DHS80DRAFT_21339 [Piptocephalis tieghemiana]
MFISKILSPYSILVGLAAYWAYPAINHAIQLGGWYQESEFQPLNVEECKVIQGMDGCEMIHIHKPWGVAILACADMERRKTWWPPIHRMTPPKDTSTPVHDPLFIYNLRSGKVKPLIIKGLDTEFVSHGFSIYPNSEDSLTLALINHAYTGSRVEFLDLERGSDQAVWRKTVGPNPELMPFPNSVVLTSPDSFYVTNDHAYTDGWKRTLEDLLFPAVTTVVSYDGIHNTMAIAADELKYANGIAMSPDGQYIYVLETAGLDVITYLRDPVHPERLHETGRIPLGTVLDNVAVDPDTGDLYVTQIPQPYVWMAHIQDPKGVHSPIRVSRIQNATHAYGAGQVRRPNHPPLPVITKMVEDDGSRISGITIGTGDKATNRWFIAGPIMEGVRVCPFPIVD